MFNWLRRLFSKPIETPISAVDYDALFGPVARPRVLYLGHRRCQSRNAASGHHCTLSADHDGEHRASVAAGRHWA